MAQQGGSNAIKWVIGCSIGCLAVAIIGGAIVGVGAYFAVTKGLDVMAREVAKELEAQYAAKKEAGNVPAEHVALFDDLVAVTQLPNASMWSIGLAATTVTSILQDNAVSEEEAAQAGQVRDFLKENPDAGMIQLGRFFETHPELKNLQDEFARYGMGTAQARP